MWHSFFCISMYCNHLESDYVYPTWYARLAMAALMVGNKTLKEREYSNILTQNMIFMFFKHYLLFQWCWRRWTKDGRKHGGGSIFHLSPRRFFLEFVEAGDINNNNNTSTQRAFGRMGMRRRAALLLRMRQIRISLYITCRIKNSNKPRASLGGTAHGGAAWRSGAKQNGTSRSVRPGDDRPSCPP